MESSNQPFEKHNYTAHIRRIGEKKLSKGKKILLSLSFVPQFITYAANFFFTKFP